MTVFQLYEILANARSGSEIFINMHGSIYPITDVVKVFSVDPDSDRETTYEIVT